MKTFKTLKQEIDGIAKVFKIGKVEEFRTFETDIKKHDGSLFQKAVFATEQGEFKYMY